MIKRTLAARVLDPEDLGLASAPAIRDAARIELGIPPCESGGKQIAQRPDSRSAGQSRVESLLESLTNVAVGYGVALTSQLVIFPLYGIHLPLTTNLAIGMWFTAVSIARSYVIRRWFNGKTIKGKTIKGAKA